MLILKLSPNPSYNLVLFLTGAFLRYTIPKIPQKVQHLWAHTAELHACGSRVLLERRIVLILELTVLTSAQHL